MPASVFQFFPWPYRPQLAYAFLTGVIVGLFPFGGDCERLSPSLSGVWRSQILGRETTLLNSLGDLLDCVLRSLYILRLLHQYVRVVLFHIFDDICYAFLL